jgi:hypothetical protein
VAIRWSFRRLGCHDRLIQRLFIARLVLNTQNLKRFAIQPSGHTVHDPIGQAGNLELSCPRHLPGGTHARPLRQFADHLLNPATDTGSGGWIVTTDPGRNIRDVPAGTPQIADLQS